jgi:hypothetical protein
MWFLSCWWEWRLLSHSGIGGNIVHLSNQCQRCQAVSAFSPLWRCQSCIGHEAMGWSNQWMVYSLASLNSHNFVAHVLYWCHFGLLSCWCHRHTGILLDFHLSLKQARRFLMAMDLKSVKWVANHLTNIVIFANLADHELSSILSS